MPDRPGIAATLFRALADEAVNVDMIEQNVSTDGHTDISFTVPKDELSRAIEVVEKVVVEIDAGGSSFDDAIGRVSLVGAGMKTNPGVAAQMFETLAAERREHRDDLHVDDPDLVRRARERRRAGGAGAARSRSSWRRCDRG